jgi:PTS system sucrose-specific IIC component
MTEFRAAAEQVIDAVGGGDNIASAAHCATRLRLVLQDEAKVDKAALERIPQVKGTFSAGGQFQIILGPGTVNKVFAEMEELAGVQEASIEQVKAEAAKHMNPAQRLVKLFSDIFVPMIPALVAAGLMMGIFNLLSQPGLFGDLPLIERFPSIADIAEMVNVMANAAFVFLPILIAIAASKVFGANMYLAAVVGMIMVHPALLNPFLTGQGEEVQSWNVFGLQIPQIGYQGTVLPVIASVYFLAKVEKALRGKMPSALDTLFTPLFAVLATGFATFLVIGPVLRVVGNLISTFFVNLYEVGGPFAGMIMGATYSLLVLTGLHHSFHGVEAGLLSDPNIGVNFLLPIWSMSNVAQGGACLMVYLLLRNRQTKIKTIALPGAVSAFLGITEPAIFGVNLRLMVPFIGGMIGGAVGGAWVALREVGMLGIGATGIPGTALVQATDIGAYVLGMLMATGTAMLATYLLVKTRGFPSEAVQELHGEEVEAEVLPAAKSGAAE